MELKDVIKDNRTEKLYWDDANLVRNFESVVETQISKEVALKKYPKIVIV